MAGRSTRRTTKTAEPEVVEADEETLAMTKFEKVMSKDPTPKQLACAEWIADNTGYDVDDKTVQLVLSLYTDFQKSPENQAVIQESKTSAAAAAEERADRTEKRAAKKTASSKPTRRSSRAAAEEEDGGEDDVEEAEAPVRRGRGATAVSGAKKAAPARRRTRAASEL